MPVTYAIIWMDHLRARVLPLDHAESAAQEISTHLTGSHLKHKANVPGSGHKSVDHEYFERLATALRSVEAALIAGPGTTKAEFKNYIEKKHPEAGHRIAGVVAADHPSDSGLRAIGKGFFKLTDAHFPRVAP